MPKSENSEQLRREANELCETAIDLMEHAALLISRSIELDKHIAKTKLTAAKKK
jgi:hypothetical protein